MDYVLAKYQETLELFELTANEVQKDPTSVISLAQNFNAMLSSVRELINHEEDPIRLQALHELTVSITHQKSLIFNRKQSKDSSK
jgi:hypothetical protein